MTYTDLPGWGNWLRERHLLQRAGRWNDKVCAVANGDGREADKRVGLLAAQPWEIVGITHERVSPARLGRSSERDDDAWSTLVILLHCCRTHACQVHIWGCTPAIASWSSPHAYCFCAQALAGIIKSDKRPGEHYLVVDVRDSDFIGGNITNCRHAPSDTFLDNLDDLVREIKNVPQVIFHCALSQARWVTKTRVSLAP